MSLLEVTKLSHYFETKTLYENVSFTLYKGEHIGVVGQNGVGKSTLIKILAGEIAPEYGNIKWNKNITVGYMDQYAEIDKSITILEYLKTAYEQLFNIEKKMSILYEEGSQDESKLILASEYQEYLISNGFYSIDAEIEKTVKGLGINAIGTDKLISELSGGERAKIILAKLFLNKPDVLLMDEPTNFFDKEHIDWMENYLSNFEGTFIIVSHDFDFLDKISNRIYNIEFGNIKKYNGSYSNFNLQKHNLEKEHVRKYKEQQKYIAKVEDYIRKNIAGVNSAIAKGRQKQLDKIERIETLKSFQSIKIHFKEYASYGGNALEVKNLEVGYRNAILPKLNFTVKNGEKLVITGFNGIGKSTLLKTLIRKIRPISGFFDFAPKTKIGYYEQDLNWENLNLTPLEIVGRYYPKMTQKEIRKYLSECQVTGNNALKKIAYLSGGEQSKVKLCILLLGEYNFLILDEITNHFDMETKEAIKKSLIDFNGTVILVSHEANFYNKVATNFFNIENCYKKLI